MSKNIDAPLAAYMQGGGTHIGKLTVVGPLPDGTKRRFAHLVKNYTIDIGDGDGPQTYVGRTGMDISALVSTSDLGVDNSESTTLPAFDGFPLEGLTTAQVIAGELDAVPFVTYIFCYTNPSLGKGIFASGTIGEQRVKGTALINLENRSITNKLKQNIVQVDSIHCRAQFGSQPLGTVGADKTEKYSCGYDYSADWVSFAISSVHPTDTDLTFFTSDFAQASNYFRLGMVRMLTGANAGQQREVASNTLASGEQTVTLMYPFPRPFADGDTGEIRWGCDKLDSLATGCRRFFGDEWVNHYRGERWLPAADTGILLMGGAGVPGELGGTGENPTGTPAPVPNPPTGGTGTPGSPTARSIGAATVDAVAYGFSTSASAATNTAAWNAAIAALPGGGGTVYSSATGTFNVSVGNTSGLIVLNRNNTRLDFSNVSLKAAHSSATPLSSFHQDMGRVDGATEFEILLPLTQTGYLATWVSGGGAATYGISEWAHGWYVTDSSSAGTIKNGTIKDCVGDAISIGRSASDIWIDNVIGTNCRRQGTSTGGDNIKITNCEFSYIGTTSPPANGPWAGIDIEVDSPESATTVYIANTRCHHNKGPGILAVVRTSDITIENCTSDYNQNYGFLASNSDTGSIKGCTFEHNKYHGVKFENDSDGWTVGGSSATSSDKNRFFNNYTSLVGVITSGSTSALSGESSATSKHVFTEDGSAVTVLYNDYGP